MWLPTRVLPRIIILPIRIVYWQFTLRSIVGKQTIALASYIIHGNLQFKPKSSVLSLSLWQFRLKLTVIVNPLTLMLLYLCRQLRPKPTVLSSRSRSLSSFCDGSDQGRLFSLSASHTHSDSDVFRLDIYPVSIVFLYSGVYKHYGEGYLLMLFPLLLYLLYLLR